MKVGLVKLNFFPYALSVGSRNLSCPQGTRKGKRLVWLSASPLWHGSKSVLTTEPIQVYGPLQPQKELESCTAYLHCTDLRAKTICTPQAAEGLDVSICRTKTFGDMLCCSIGSHFRGQNQMQLLCKSNVTHEMEDFYPKRYYVGSQPQKKFSWYWCCSSQMRYLALNWNLVWILPLISKDAVWSLVIDTPVEKPSWSDQVG